MSAAVSGDAVVAGECLVTDDVECSQLVGQSPGLAFVQPHQWGVDDKLLLHGQVEGDVQALDECIAAVGIAGIVRLRYSCHEMAYSQLAGMDGSYAQEEEVTSRYKRVGQGVCRLFLIHHDVVAGEGILSQCANQRDIHFLEMYSRFMGQTFGKFHFEYMFLTVCKGEGIDFVKVLFGPIQTGGRVLSSTKNDQGF